MVPTPAPAPTPDPDPLPAMLQEGRETRAVRDRGDFAISWFRFGSVRYRFPFRSVRSGSARLGSVRGTQRLGPRASRTASSVKHSGGRPGKTVFTDPLLYALCNPAARLRLKDRHTQKSAQTKKNETERASRGNRYAQPYRQTADIENGRP